MANFKSVVEGYGGRARSWKQSKFIGKMTFGHRGVCSPLAAKWIANRKLGINFAKDTKTEEGRAEVMGLKLQQCDTANNANYIASYLANYGLDVHFRHQWRNELSLSELLSMISSGPGYYFVGLTNRGADDPLTGHAFAFDSHKYMFFDPNVGQASFQNSSDLSSCFSSWFRLFYLDLKGAALLERYIG